jgi:protein-S-isoprenylcysteine O-methyltransferase Ste14
MTEPEPELREEEPERDRFWAKFLVGFAAAAGLFAVFAVVSGRRHPLSDSDVPIGWVLLALGSWITYRGVRSRSLFNSFVGLSLLAAGGLGFLGVTPGCTGDCTGAGG